MGGKKIKLWSDDDKALLRGRFRVDISTGEVWLRETGDPAPMHLINPLRKQYLAVSAKIAGKWTKVRLHHLIWFFATGEQSVKMIDHIRIDEDITTPYGNRFENLRQCTDKQNCANKSARGFRAYTKADGTVWYYAVISWKDKSTGKVKQKRSSLVSTPEEAQAIYHSWKKQRFGKFVFTGDVVLKCGFQTTLNEG
ncbi:hypothetical protein [Pectobacterium phage Wc4-1]|uniref:HNH endonuclease n=1 Tax=Pectobacterium phage Wc4 TaxID=2652428 RepID=A0A5P8D499_9CAUD|nr:hypothetical protein [Pectobacterium phage Wc4]QFP94052.1 hypothetical protein [Pectobacterium phage Wc4-1]